MIKSDRKFGIEIEFLGRDARSMNKIAGQIPIVSDGSLRPHKYGGEWVSPPLEGRNGERQVANACSILKVNGADASHPKTSLHVHLDGKRDDGRVIESTKRDPEAEMQYGISRAAAKELGASNVRKLVQGQVVFNPGLKISSIDNVTYISKGNVTRHPRVNYRFFTFKQVDRTRWLRNVFYFYTYYTEVMLAMVSNSRRKGNMYCIPLSDSFSLDEIEKCETMDHIIDVWYKNRGIGGHYDDSRYHNVNLHSFFDRHGTVEIRSHGATLDPNKILMWVRLHQHIVDKLEFTDIEEIKSDKDVFLSFLDFISDDPLLVDYYKRLIGYFGGVSIREGKVIRK